MDNAVLWENSTVQFMGSLLLDVQVFKFFAAGSLEKSSGSPVV